MYCIKEIAPVLFFFALTTFVSHAAVINVPDDHETIQSAINSAEDGDSVLVAAGEYIENIDFSGKDIVLIGDPDAPEEVMIDGNGDGSVVTIANGETAAAVISGFTIRNGNSDTGGGICISGSAPAISNVIITANRGRVGGGMFCNGNAEVLNSRFIENSSTLNGGALTIQQSNPSFSDVEFINNTSGFGGGVHLYMAEGQFENVVFNGNTATENNGGAINIYRSDPMFNNITVSNNEAAENGGGIYANISNFMVSNAVITRNSASYGGGVMCISNPSAIFIYSVVAFNTAEGDGGGLQFAEATGELYNVTVSENTAGGLGGGIYAVSNADVTINNSILWGNEPQAFAFNENPRNILTIAYTDIEGGQNIPNRENNDWDWGGGIIDADPQFADPENEDLHLTENSPCIDAGDPEADQDPDETRADMGAFYFHQEEPEAHIYNVPDDYETIQAAIDAAENADTVLVAHGEYVENIDFSGKDIVLLGDPDNPGEVIIDGNGEGSVVTFASGESRDAILNGFTIRNGANQNGGGIYCEGASPVLRNLIVSSNQAVLWGGGLVFLGGSESLLEEVIVSENSANPNGYAGGGGLSALGESTIEMENCQVTNNRGGRGWGGGISICEGSSLNAVNVDLSGNSADVGGGYCFCDASGSVTGGEIQGNGCGEGGGSAIICQNAEIDFTDLYVHDNNRGGGVIAFGASSVSFTRAKITHNTATHGKSCLRITSGSSVELEYSEITACNVNGAATIEHSSELTLLNCTMSKNQTNGIIIYDDSQANLLNTIVWDNGDAEVQFNGNDGVLNIGYSDLQGSVERIQNRENGTVNDLGGILDVDPLFVDAENDDYHLQEHSLCIDAGDPESPQDPDETPADMGAYYFEHDPWPVIHISPEEMTFSGVNPGESGQDTLVISNRGQVDLIVSEIIVSDENFNVDFDGEFSLEPNASRNVIVTFNPEAELVVRTECRITSNDPRLGEITIPITGVSRDHGIFNVPDEFATIQGSIDYVSDGDTIIVADGVYHEMIDFGSKDIILGSNFILDENEEHIAETIIDGEGNGRPVIFSGGESRDAALIGLTIRNGRAENGAGILCQNASPTLLNLIVEDNNATFGGGGIHITAGSEPLLRNIAVSGSRVVQGSGGGILVDEESILDFENGTIESNIAEHYNPHGYGGGICIRDNSQINISNVNFIGNRGKAGAGLTIMQSSGSVTGGTYRENTINGSGGGIYLEDSDAEITDVEIIENQADYGGTGILMVRSSPIISGATISHNSAWNSFATVGIANDSHPIFRFSEISFNSGYGAELSAGSSVEFTNCTIFGNGSYGILLNNQHGATEATITNTILRENGNAQIRFDWNGGSANLSYSNLQGGLDLIVNREGREIEWGEGMMDLDPLFVDPENDELQLTENSPCIDAGDPETDLDPDESRTDMGAYYFDHEPWPIIQVSPLNLQFPGVEAGESAQESITISNIGNANLDVSNIEITEGPFTVDFEGEFTIVPGSQRDIVVTFAPEETDVFHASCLITSNDPRFQETQVSITGVSRMHGIYYVPDEFETILIAIDMVNDGDTIIVDDGIYEEPIDFTGKNIVLGSRFILDEDEGHITETIIDGGNESRPVTFSNVEGRDAVLVGLTVRNGSSDNGGGILIQNASPTLLNLIIEGNQALIGGGGIYVTDSSEPLLRNITVTENTSIEESGGGLLVDEESNLNFEGGLIEANTANYPGYGGGMCTRGGSRVDISDVDIIANRCLRGSGFYFENSTGIINGGFYSDNFGNGEGGTDFRTRDSDLEIIDVRITDNNADRNMYIGNNSHLIFRFSELSFNPGFAVQIDTESSAEFNNCTVFGNGAGIRLNGSDEVTVTNTILRGNGNVQIWFDRNGGSLDVSYSDIEGGLEGFINREGHEINWGDGMIDADPLFVDPENGDLRLTEMSPCIDAGDPESPRDPDETRADMGAYYFEHEPWPIIDLDPVYLQFAGVEPGDDAQDVITIYNRGERNLVVSDISVADGPFSLDFEGEFSVESGASREVAVSFAPEEADVYNSLCTITSNDPRFGEVQVRLTGSSRLRGIFHVPDELETIREALDIVSDGDTIVVADGIYEESIDFSGKSVVVGSQYLLDEDEEHISATILEGSGERRPVLFSGGEEREAALVGLTVRNGQAEYGGGILCQGAGPQLDHLIVENNSTISSGGGILITDGSTPLVQNVIVRGNSSAQGHGGGVCIAEESEVEMRDCLIQDNSSLGNGVRGGGLGVESGSRLDVQDTDFIENQGADGGGISFHSSLGSVRNCQFRENTCRNVGGGISLFESDPEFTEVQVVGNQTNRQYYGYGGGISIDRSSPIFDLALISENHANYSGGGVLVGRASAPVFTNSEISNNSGYGGFTVYAEEESNPQLTNCTVFGNTNNGVVLRQLVNLELSNSIIWNNQQAQLHFDRDGGSVTVSYSNVQDGREAIQDFDHWDITWGDGNIDADPLFADPENGDLRLTEMSPCIDAGAALIVVEGDTLVNIPEEDYNHEAPDMGAYESDFQGVPDIAVEPDEFDFGMVRLNHSIERTLTISNSGVGNLIISAMNCQPPFTSDFQAELTIEPGDTSEITVRFTPEEAGLHEGTLTIRSNDPDEEELSVTLQGEGLPRELIAAFETPGTANDIQIWNNLAYVADGEDGLRIIDIADLDNLNEIGALDTEGNACAVEVIGHYVYIANGDSGLCVIDVSDPEHPGLAGEFDTPGMANHVQISANYAYVADGETGLLILDVSDPDEITEVSRCDSPGFAEGLAVYADFVFIADRTEGVWVIDVRNPAEPEEIGSIDTPDWALQVAVAGDYLYVADRQSGVRVMEITEPWNPAEVAVIETRGDALGLTKAGDFLFVACDEAGLTILDISDPTEPVEAGHYRNDGNVLSADLSGHTAFAANEIGFGVYECREVVGEIVAGLATDEEALDFGQVFMGEEEDIRLNILNEGSAVVNIINMFITGADAAMFEISRGGGVFDIDPDDDQRIEVTFAPTSEGAKNALLVIQSDDLLNSQIEIPLAGFGRNPEFADFLIVPFDYETIQEAIDAAENGNTVLVRPGTYNENIDFSGKQITVGSLFMTSQDEQYIANTIIDGGGNGSVATFANEETDQAVLTGFTIRNGSSNEGAGIRCLNSTPTLLHLVITENQGYGVSLNGSDASMNNCTISCNSNRGIYAAECSPTISDVAVQGNQGGGMALNQSEAVLSSVEITENTSGEEDGGGIILINSPASLTNVTVSNNSTEAQGGGMVLNGSHAVLSNVTVSGNGAGDNGGGVILNESDAELSEVVVSGNSSDENGGGILIIQSNAVLIDVTVSESTVEGNGAGLYIGQSNPTLAGVTITFNEAWGDGGGVYMGASDEAYAPEMENVFITNNSADNGGGIFCCGPAQPVLTKSVIAGNTADSHAGIACDESAEITLTNVTLCHNTAERVSGALFLNDESRAVILNSIFWQNSPAEVYFNWRDNPNYLEISYTDIEGGREAITDNRNGEVAWGEGNLNADPLFADAENGDYSITWANYPEDDETRSPCIDAGHPDSPEDPDGSPADIGAVYYHQSINMEITLEPDELNFDRVPINTTRELNLRIINIGNEDLIISNVTADEPFAVDFEAEFALEPDESHDLTVTFAPEEENEYEDTLTIHSNDPDNEIVEVPLHGAGYQPNRPPEVIAEIEDVTVDEDCGRYVIADLGEVFRDPDEDELTFFVEGAPDEVNMDLADGHVLFIEPDENFNLPDGMEITVTADDGFDEHRDNEDFGPLRIREFEGDNTAANLSFNYNQRNIRRAINRRDKSGSASLNKFVQLPARDLFTSETFILTIYPVNDSPEVVNPIEDIEVDEDCGYTEIVGLDEVFFDVEDDGSLNFDISETPDELNLTISDENVLFFNPAENFNLANGIEITITADDNAGENRDVGISRRVRRAESNFDNQTNLQLSDSKDGVTLRHNNNNRTNFDPNAQSDNPQRDATVSDRFILTIIPVNDAPEVINPIEDLELEFNPGRVVIADLEEIFHDVDIAGGDELTFSTGEIPDEIQLEIDEDNILTVEPEEDYFNHNGVEIRVIAEDNYHEIAIETFTLIILECEGAPWQAPEETGFRHTFNIEEANIYLGEREPQLLNNGDWIGVFTPDSNCVGAVEWNAEGVIIVAVGDNPETDEIEGFTPDESIHFRIQNSEHGQQYLARFVILNEDEPRIFRYDGETDAQIDACHDVLIPTVYFQPIINDMQDHSILIQSAEIIEVPLEIGDEIGVYTPDGICVGGGVNIWRLGGERRIGISARSDDPDTDEIDGFREGEEMRFEIWDFSLDSLFYSNVDFLDGVEEFEANGHSVVSLIGFNGQQIQLNLNWQMISTQVIDLIDTSVVEIWDRVVGRENLLITKDNWGRFYLPEWGFNNITRWMTNEGYWVKMRESDEDEEPGLAPNDGEMAVIDTLIMGGISFVEEEAPIDLVESWNIVAYYPRSPLDARTAFANLVEGEQLNIAKNDMGGFYLPAWDFSNMGDLTPTKGYQVKVDDDGEFVWNIGEVLMSAQRSDNVSTAPVYYQIPENTGSNMSLLVLNSAFNDINAELGVFSVDNECIGCVCLHGNGPWGTAVWGDDWSTPNRIEGALEGERLSFRIWDGQTEKEITPVFAEGESIYKKDGVAVISINEQPLPNEFRISSIYPNPFNSKTRITYSLDEQAFVSVKLFDVNGCEIATLYEGQKAPGKYTLMLNGQDYASGLYLCQLIKNNGEQKAIRKLVLLR